MIRLRQQWCPVWVFCLLLVLCPELYLSLSDRGICAVTATGTAGSRSSTACTVREYEAVHHVSVAINVSHWLLWCGEAWGTDPRYSWLHEKAPVTEEVGRVSPDGTELHLSGQPCGHFTCIVSNRLGHSSATYTAEPCERQVDETVVGLTFLVILLIGGGILAFLVWRSRIFSAQGSSDGFPWGMTMETL